MKVERHSSCKGATAVEQSDLTGKMVKVVGRLDATLANMVQGQAARPQHADPQRLFLRA